MKHFQFSAVAALFPLTTYVSIGASSDKKSLESNHELHSSGPDVIATTQSGEVAGYIDNHVYVYKGIPYAKAERFMPPTAPDRWKGVRQAFAFRWDYVFPDEDCLQVNIWTPGLSDGKRRPVMVWLHGGGACSGQELPSYDGTNLARKGDVVVVTLNHRLNVLGFLDPSAYGDKYARSGNVGLLDLVAALGWIQTNIASFGGDLSNVIIFGQSGGGGKVSTLPATPLAQGLFHKATIQSGSMLRTMESRYSRRIGEVTVEELGISPTHINDLSKIPYDQLLAAGEKAVARVRKEVEKEGNVSSFIFGWAPTVDGSILPSQPFDPQAPLQSKDITLLIGTTLHEFTTSTYVPSIRTATGEQAIDFLRKKYEDRTKDFLVAFSKAYPGKTTNLVDVDFIFRPGAVEQARIKVSRQGTPVYMYLFLCGSHHTSKYPLYGDTLCLRQRRTPRKHDRRGSRIMCSLRSHEWLLDQLCPH